MATHAVDDDWVVYEGWGEEFEASLFAEGDLENFETVNGLLQYKGEGLKSHQRTGGVKI